MLVRLTLFILVLFLCAVDGNVFEYEAVDKTGTVVSLSQYKNAKAILIGRTLDKSYIEQDVSSKTTP